MRETFHTTSVVRNHCTWTICLLGIRALGVGVASGNLTSVQTRRHKFTPSWVVSFGAFIVRKDRLSSPISLSDREMSGGELIAVYRPIVTIWPSSSVAKEGATIWQCRWNKGRHWSLCRPWFGQKSVSVGIRFKNEQPLTGLKNVFDYVELWCGVCPELFFIGLSALRRWWEWGGASDRSQMV